MPYLNSMKKNIEPLIQNSLNSENINYQSDIKKEIKSEVLEELEPADIKEEN